MATGGKWDRVRKRVKEAATEWETARLAKEKKRKDQLLPAIAALIEAAANGVWDVNYDEGVFHFLIVDQNLIQTLLTAGPLVDLQLAIFEETDEEYMFVELDKHSYALRCLSAPNELIAIDPKAAEST